MGEEQRGYVIDCREWAAIHLDRPIKYRYTSKRNAERAMHDPKRNTVTVLCHYMRSLYARVCHLETILLRITKEVSHYNFDACDTESCGESREADSGSVEGCGELTEDGVSAGRGSTTAGGSS